MSFLRITAGTLRGRRVPVPRDEVRPTSERARQAFFNIIGNDIGGARFLDLFAGSGIFSLEALSRGAASATAIDKSRQHILQIEKTAAAFGVAVRTITDDVIGSLRRLESDAFDVVYADPPYDYHDYEKLLDALSRLTLSGPAIVAVEHRRRSEPFSSPSDRLLFWRRAEYGEVWISFFRTRLPQKLQEQE